MSTNNLMFIKKEDGFKKQEVGSNPITYHVKNEQHISVVFLLFHSNLNVTIDLEDENSSCDIKVLYLIKQKEKMDIQVKINHIKGETTSSQIIKGIILDEAQVNFVGKIYIAPNAQKSDGHQNHRAVLLSNEGRVTSTPELEIYADDVKCSHGSATGPLEQESIFYLMSRGISKKEAERILLHSFINDIIPNEYQTITDEWINQHV